MKRQVLAPLGLVLILAGIVWTLQGLDYLKGSPMSGQTFWAIAGPVTAVIGAVLVLRGSKSDEKDQL